MWQRSCSPARARACRLFFLRLILLGPKRQSKPIDRRRTLSPRGVVAAGIADTAAREGNDQLCVPK